MQRPAVWGQVGTQPGMAGRHAAHAQKAEQVSGFCGKEIQDAYQNKGQPGTSFIYL